MYRNPVELWSDTPLSRLEDFPSRSGLVFIRGAIVLSRPEPLITGDFPYWYSREYFTLIRNLCPPRPGTPRYSYSTPPVLTQSWISQFPLVTLLPSQDLSDLLE